MKKHIPIMITVVTIFLVNTFCHLTAVPHIDEVTLYVRNMSTISGVTVFVHRKPPEPEEHYSLYLERSSQSGTSVDGIIPDLKGTGFTWSVERAMDSVVVDSGRCSFLNDAWLLIEGRPEVNNGEWSCTFSYEPLW